MIRLGAILAAAAIALAAPGMAQTSGGSLNLSQIYGSEAVSLDRPIVTGDDNVHHQNSEQLIDRLISFNKPFSMMAYPNRTHGISEGVNTRLHMYTMLTTYLHDHLPPDAK